MDDYVVVTRKKMEEMSNRLYVGDWVGVMHDLEDIVDDPVQGSYSVNYDAQPASSVTLAILV